VHPFGGDEVEQLAVVQRPDTSPGRRRVEVDRGLDGPGVGRLQPERSARRVAGDLPVDLPFDLRDEQPVRPGLGVVLEPRPPRVDGERLDVERRDGVLDVVVVDAGECRQVVLDAGRTVMPPVTQSP